MKKFLALAAFFILIPCAASADESITMDGNWWQSLSEHEQVNVVQGMVASAEDVFDSGVFADNLLILEKYPKVNPTSPNTPRYSHTFGFYAHEIQDFYALHSDKLNVRVGSLFACMDDETTWDICSKVWAK